MSGWTPGLVIAEIQAWDAKYGSPPTSRQWRTGGEHPSRSTVVHMFGSWGAALRAAGFQPLQGQGPKGDPAAFAEARRLKDDGVSNKEIAERFGVAKQTVDRWLQRGPECECGEIMREAAPRCGFCAEEAALGLAA